MRRMMRAAVAFGVANLVLYNGSCGSSNSGGPSNTDAGSPIADVVYDGQPPPTDEALNQLLAAPASADTTHGGVFDFPADGAALPASPIPTFAWHTGGALPDAGVDATPEGGGDAPLGRMLRPITTSPFGPERAAYAHGAPTNGKAYFLVFSTATNAKLLRVFTIKTTYVPSADAWNRLTSAHAPITVSLETGIFDNDALAPDGGPWQGGSITMTVGG